MKYRMTIPHMEEAQIKTAWNSTERHSCKNGHIIRDICGVILGNEPPLDESTALTILLRNGLMLYCHLSKSVFRRFQFAEYS